MLRTTSCSLTTVLLLTACTTPVATQRASIRVTPPEDAAAAQRSANDGAELAKQLANPVASLISVPLQLNFDQNIGPRDGERWQLNLQPVIPIELDEDWNLISRTIVSAIVQEDVIDSGTDAGTGDTVQSFFFSPAKPTSRGWTWGAGPVILVPTASDDALGAEQLGLGPTGVALRQQGPWTYGALVNHIWKVAGGSGRTDVNATFVQPFLAYNTEDAWTYTINSEATYDWQRDDLALPLNAVVSKVLDLNGQLVQVGGGVRYWLDDADLGPEGWGLRFNLVFLFPKQG